MSLSHDPDAYLNLDATPFYTEKMPAASVGTAARPDTHWVKEYTDPVAFAEKYVREKQGLSYTEDHRNAYLYNCLNMMNLLGVPRTDAESLLCNFDLPEREKQSVLKSGYKRTADFGKFERPYTWKEETKTKTKTKTKTEASLSLCHNISGCPHTHAREASAIPRLPVAAIHSADGGMCRHQTAARRVDLTESHVRNPLSELTASGKLIKPGRGKYELAFPSSVTSRACV